MVVVGVERTLFENEGVLPGIAIAVAASEYQDPFSTLELKQPQVGERRRRAPCKQTPLRIWQLFHIQSVNLHFLITHALSAETEQVFIIDGNHTMASKISSHFWHILNPPVL